MAEIGITLPGKFASINNTIDEKALVSEPLEKYFMNKLNILTYKPNIYYSEIMRLLDYEIDKINHEFHTKIKAVAERIEEGDEFNKYQIVINCGFEYSHIVIDCIEPRQNDIYDENYFNGTDFVI